MLDAVGITLGARVSGVSARFEPGRITAICGPNGAGKSTLLQILAGLIAPDGGDVTLDGAALSGMPARERAKAVGYLPQTPEIAWDVTVRNLVALGRMPHGDENEEKVYSALSALDLHRFADRRAQLLSGGEKARVLLARVLAGEPRWILADEPLAALDLAHQLALLRYLRLAANDGAGVVLVVHDLALAMNHADRVLVLDRGRMMADGDPESALSEERLREVWRVEARWMGAQGARALIAF